MMHDPQTCDHPQCHGLTNFLTQDEQLRVAFKKGDKVRVGLIQLELYNEYIRNAHLQTEKRKKYMEKYNAIQYEKRRQWGLKGSYIAKRNRAFAYKWTLQIEWLLK